MTLFPRAAALLGRVSDRPAQEAAEEMVDYARAVVENRPPRDGGHDNRAEINLADGGQIWVDFHPDREASVLTEFDALQSEVDDFDAFMETGLLDPPRAMMDDIEAKRAYLRMMDEG